MLSSGSSIKDVHVGLWTPHRIGHRFTVISIGRLQLPVYMQNRYGLLFLTKQKPYSFNSASEIRQDHPLNLSILLSGGKEINEDCLSSGE
jgi:hypothetical protein